MPVGVSAYTALGTVTLASSASSVTFAGIPATGYRDLVLVYEGTVSSSTDFTTRFNGDTTGSNYFRVFAFGNGSSASSGTTNESYWMYQTTAGRGTNILNIFDYSATDKHKSILNRYDQAGNGASMIAGRWASTAAITSITTNGPFNAGSNFSLYGIAS